MDDLFNEILNKSNIKLIYITSNPVLSCVDFNDMLIVYAHEFFRNCPENIANAVVGLYLMENRELSDTIINYVQEFDSTYTINDVIIRKKDTEMQINEIVISRGNGNNTPIDDQTIKVDEDDFVELEITIEKENQE